MLRKFVLISAVAAGACIGVSVWFFRGTGWKFRSRFVGGTLLFDEHISPGPAAIYTAAENAEMARKVDMTRFVADARKRAEILDILNFGKQVGVGEQAPLFELRTTGGGLIRLAGLRGKNVVFMFAAMTCPPARAQTPRFEELQGKYNPEDVVFFVVYSRERHPGESGYREFSFATTNAEKLAHARMLDQLTALPVAVDDIEESTLKMYGNVPNSAYVIDREGTIVFRSTWADSRKIERVLDALLESQERPAAGRN